MRCAIQNENFGSYFRRQNWLRRINRQKWAFRGSFFATLRFKQLIVTVTIVFYIWLVIIIKTSRMQLVISYFISTIIHKPSTQEFIKFAWRRFTGTIAQWRHFWLRGQEFSSQQRLTVLTSSCSKQRPATHHSLLHHRHHTTSYNIIPLI